MSDQQRKEKQPTKFFSTNRGEMDWYLFDAQGKTLGRLASEIVKVLRGKHKAQYTPNADLGDGVIIINAKEVKVSGRKAAQKEYISHSGYVGGLSRIPYSDMMEKNPEKILEHAVKGMLPKTKLGEEMVKKLRIYSGSEHDMQAQKPVHVAI
ncbi:MAG: 50S ribosomal protein L13 [Verrucomicrobia bacterium]|nr:50S ribosomal protein L13 [Verrucomicrobiota bacterium]